MKRLLMIGWLLLPHVLFSQDSTEKAAVWKLSGYLKELAWVRFDGDFTQASLTNLVHNRLNVRWEPSAQWSGRVEVRNRFYWGDDVQAVPRFKQALRNENEKVNLSAGWFGTKTAILHTNVERLWLEYKKPEWNIRAGRQRINWGLTNTWNPNDLFNTYNFLDFDYEERAGSDAVKGQYLLSDRSTMEVAVAGTGQGSILAAKYFTNYRNYDLQWNAGVYQNTLTAGFGWAGSIKEVGFKGEVQYYAGSDDAFSRWLAVVEGDYVFKNGWYLSSALLYNERGLFRPLNGWNGLTFQASPRSLMPTRWNLLLNSAKEFTPLFSGSLNVVYAPGVNLLIHFPSLRYNLKTNWDLDLVWQSFFAETTSLEALSHAGFLRLKWSF